MHEVLRIRNWKEFQHYSYRCPPWIKLHFRVLSSKDWVSANDTERVLAIACMLVASQSREKDGRFEADPAYFRRVAYLNSEPDFKPLISLGFLEVLADASGCKQLLENVCTETEKSRDREEKPRSPKPLTAKISDQVKEQRQRHNVNAKAKRESKEAEGYREAHGGAPSPQIVRPLAAMKQIPGAMSEADLVERKRYLDHQKEILMGGRIG